jgi:hypothetical protein
MLARRSAGTFVETHPVRASVIGFDRVDLPRSQGVAPMKKQNGKKLALLTQTVRNLDPADLGNVAGGKTTAITCTCPPSTRCTGTITD